MINSSKNTGFSIVELAIVTVIIALLVGTIIVSNDIMDAADRSTIIKELNEYNASIRNFKLKYDALPGDMDNASDYWGDASDGDGNGYITNWITEGYYGWRHLYFAGFIRNLLSGSDPEDVMPESAIGDVYYKLDTAGEFSGNNSWFLGTYNIYEQSGNYIAMGGIGEDASGRPNAHGFLTGAEAQSIDKKIDDGNASAGKWVALRGIYHNGSSDVYHGGCVSGTDTGYRTAEPGAVTYDLDDDEEGCRIIYFMRGLN